MKTKTILIFMVLSTMLLLGNVFAANEAAQKAGYHNVLFTETIVNYNTLGAAIIMQNPLVVQGMQIGTTDGGGYVDGVSKGTVITGMQGNNLTLVSTGAWTVSKYGKTNILYRGGGNGIYYSALEVSDVPSGFSKLLLMKSGGNVGIGLTDPQQPLDVNGNVRATGFCMGADCKTSWADVGGTGGGSNWVVSGENIYRQAGRVGIGTNNPQQSLHVSGNIRTDGKYFAGGQQGVSLSNLPFESSAGSNCMMNISGGIITHVSCCVAKTQAQACVNNICGYVDDGCGGKILCPDCGFGKVCGFTDDMIGQTREGIQSGMCVTDTVCNPVVDILGFKERGRMFCYDMSDSVDSSLMHGYLDPQDACCNVNPSPDFSIYSRAGNCEGGSICTQSNTALYPLAKHGSDSFVGYLTRTPVSYGLDNAWYCGPIPCPSPLPPYSPPLSCFESCKNQGLTDAQCAELCIEAAI